MEIWNVKINAWVKNNNLVLTVYRKATKCHTCLIFSELKKTTLFDKLFSSQFHSLFIQKYDFMVIPSLDRWIVWLEICGYVLSKVCEAVDSWRKITVSRFRWSSVKDRPIVSIFGILFWYHLSFLQSSSWNLDLWCFRILDKCKIFWLDLLLGRNYCVDYVRSASWIIK